jgi:hypothetical protein
MSEIIKPPFEKAALIASIEKHRESIELFEEAIRKERQAIAEAEILIAHHEAYEKATAPQ